MFVIFALGPEDLGTVLSPQMFVFALVMATPCPAWASGRPHQGVRSSIVGVDIRGLLAMS